MALGGPPAAKGSERAIALVVRARSTLSGATRREPWTVLDPEWRWRQRWATVRSGIDSALTGGMRTHILVSTAIAIVGAMAAGCTAQVTEDPAYAPAPPPPAPAAEEDVIYDVEPPVADIELYPSVVYGGVSVYYVGGVWYRRGPNGWGRYSVEPPGLARVRVAHAREARWAHEGPPRPAPRGAAELQRRARPAPRPAPRPEHREERR
jgi:hypothetical protein